MAKKMDGDDSSKSLKSAFDRVSARSEGSPVKEKVAKVRKMLNDEANKDGGALAPLGPMPAAQFLMPSACSPKKWAGWH